MTLCPGCGTDLTIDDEPTRADTDGPAVIGPAGRLSPGMHLGTRYEVVSVLGEGGMGTVYKARDLELGRTVALKVIRSDLAARPKVVERFKREILLASQVTHRNVLRMFDLGAEGDLRFISMSYVEGSDLGALLEREGAVPIDRVMLLARQIGEALQAAHDAGIVHRDLKPANILIDREGNAYITDFGISRSIDADSSMTETGVVLGTVEYMSPEQARGDRPDHRADIYSFGVILYEMLTGGLPFKGGDALSIMMKRIHYDAPTIRHVRPDLPPWLSAVVARALQRDPADRYQSVRDLLRDLRRGHASVSWHKMRRPLAITAAGLVLVAALVAGGLRLLGRNAAGGAAPPRASVAILPFQNATGDPRFDWARAGLPSLLRSGLLEAKDLRVVGEDRVQGILDSLRVPEGEDLRPATVRRIATLIGADNVLAGRLVKIADRLRIDASLERTGPAAAPGESLLVEGEGDQAIFAMVDELTERVRAELGVARGWGEPARSATDLSTHSVESLAAYGDALALARAGNQIDAAKRLESAVQADPGFSAARALLAETYDRLGYSDKATAEAEKAASGASTGTPYEAARIRGVRARLAGDLAAAEREYTSLCAIAPNDAEGFFDLAEVQQEQGELPKALESMQRVVVLDPKHPTAHFALGRLQFGLGNPAGALQELNSAVSLHSEAGNDEGTASALGGLGNVYLSLGRYDEAIRQYQGSLEIRRRIGDQRGVWKSLINLASTQGRLGRDEEAIRLGTEAVSIARGMGDRAGLVHCNRELGEILQEAGRPADALETYQESLKILRETNDPADLARTLANVGSVNGVLGRYLEALFSLKEALAKRRELGDKSEIIPSLTDLGIVEQYQGRYEEALRYYTEGLSLAKEIDLKPGMIILLPNLSNIHEEQGNYGPALSLLADAEKLAREVKDDVRIATCLTYEGSARLKIGDFTGADTALTEAMRLARETKRAPLIPELEVSQAALLLARGERARAVAVAKDAVAAARGCGAHRLLLLARLQEGETLRSTAEIEAVLKEATTTGLLPVATSARLALARARLDAGQPREAATAAVAAIEGATAMGHHDSLFQAHSLAGRALWTSGDRSGAAVHFAAALDPLQEMRAGLTDDLRAIFAARPESVLFGKSAEEAFRALGRPADADRLRGLLAP